MRTTAELARQAESFRAAHHGDAPIVLPNVWDVMSARVVEGSGFPFLATSSNAIAQSLGAADNNTMDTPLVFEVIRRISDATALPVTADIEAGYSLEPALLAAELLGAGAIGCNLEDTNHGGEGLVDAGQQADRIAALRDVGRDLGVELVINARVDCVVRKVGGLEEQVAESIRRGRLYLEAGADCIYPIMLTDEAGIASIVESLAAPVNINLRAGGPSLARLKELGVMRVSYASGVFRYLQRILTEVTAGLAEAPESIL